MSTPRQSDLVAATEARRRKVAKLIDAIDRLATYDVHDPRRPSAGFLADLDVDHRAAIAKLAGVGYPSMETWETVVDTIRTREQVLNQTFIARLEASMTGEQGDTPMFASALQPGVRIEPDDPFEGLPR